MMALPVDREHAQTPPPRKLGAVLRIELTSARRRHLTSMAQEAAVPVDDFASQLLSDLIDDDAKAHGVTVKNTTRENP